MVCSMTSIPQALCCYPKEYRVALANPLPHSSYSTHKKGVCQKTHAVAENCCLVPFRACLHAHSYSATPFYGYNAQPCPGQGKEAPEWQKGCKRVACCAACVLLTPLASASVCLGMGLRCVSHNNRPFMQYLQTSQTSPQPLSLRRESPFHVATLNVGLNPSSVAIAMDLRPPHLRAHELVTSLIEDPHAPRVLMMQELWSEEGVQILATGLRRKYEHILCNIGPAVGGMSSGYFVASQYPLIQVDFTRFQAMSKAHSLPPRGILGVHFTTEENERVIVYGFHAQSMDGKEEALIRAAQFKQIKKVVDQDQGAYPGVHQVVVGDTNTTALDQWGFSTQDQMEKPALDALRTNFEDLFLRDHHPLTGMRTSGKTTFLASDTERIFAPVWPFLPRVAALKEWLYETLLPEPTGSWYVGPFQPIPEGLQATLAAQRLADKLPAPQAVVTPEENTWGTSLWFYRQPVNTARYDAVLLPLGSSLDGTAENRRLFVASDKQSSPSDHALVSALLYKKSRSKEKEPLMKRDNEKCKRD